MDEAPLPFNTPKGQELMIIQHNEEKFQLQIIKEEEKCITLIISKYEKQNIKYIKKMNFDEIKGIHKIFGMLNSCEDFIDYIKAAYENKKLSIKIDKNELILIISAEYLFKSQLIEIPLIEKKINLESYTEEINQEISLLKKKLENLENNYKKEINDLKEENLILKEQIKLIIDDQKKENKNLKEQIKLIIDKQNDEERNLKEEIKNLKQLINKENIKRELIKNKDIMIDSSIMKSEEFDLIEKEIESRINKKIKGTKKLYQANVDGGDPSIFHYKCDNIPNTLTIIKTKGKRRFGGFASTIWESKLLYKEDINSFLFSLDNKKIYSYKKNGLALFCNKINGPSFGNSKNKLGTVSIYGNPIKGWHIIYF